MSNAVHRRRMEVAVVAWSLFVATASCALSAHSWNSVSAREDAMTCGSAVGSHGVRAWVASTAELYASSLGRPIGSSANRSGEPAAGCAELPS